MRIYVIGLLFFNMSLVAESMILHKGLMTAEGTFNFPIEYNHNYFTKISMALSPRVGYFVLDNLWVGGTAELMLNILNTDKNAPYTEGMHWSLGAGLQYYIPTKTQFFPFAGCLVSFGATNTQLISLRINLEFPLGVLWALNEHVGLSVGIPIKLSIDTRSLFSKIAITPGVIGVAAFF